MNPRSSPLVSVIVPSYNHQAYVGQAIESVLASTLRDIELVLVDDGSTDGSLSVIHRFHDPRLKVLAQENQGAHAAMNRGVQEARGEWVAFLNSDDLYSPEKLERHVSVHQANGKLEATASRVRHISARGKPLFRFHPTLFWYAMARSVAERHRNLFESLLIVQHLVTTSALFMKRSTFLETGGFLPLRYCHDWHMYLTLAARKGLAVLDEPLTAYRCHGRNTVRESEYALLADANFVIMWHLWKALEGRDFGIDPRRATELLRESPSYIPELAQFMDFCRLTYGSNPVELAGRLADSESMMAGTARSIAREHGLEREKRRHPLTARARQTLRKFV